MRKTVQLWKAEMEARITVCENNIRDNRRLTAIQKRLQAALKSELKAGLATEKKLARRGLTT